MQRKDRCLNPDALITSEYQLLFFHAFIKYLPNGFSSFFQWITQGDFIIIISFSFKFYCGYFFLCFLVDNISFSFYRAPAINSKWNYY